jgi:hypothetical protein
MKYTLTKSSLASTMTLLLIGCGGGGGSTTSATTSETEQNPTPTITISNPSLCEGVQTAFALSKEVNGDLNIVKDNTEDCYKINLSSNNGTETYTFFMNILPGTEGFTRTDVRLIDTDNEETPFTEKNKMYKEDTHLRKTFTVTKDGTYYLKIKRGTNQTKYAFSLHPSVGNGLKQNKDKEINDMPTMAAPITLDEAKKDIKGSLHVSRDAYNSLRGTDDTDYYSIDITKAGTYTFYMNLLPGTESYSRTDVRFIDESEAETPITVKSLDLYKESDNIRKEITLAVGKHHIKIQRASNKMKYAFSLQPSIANGLVQNSDKEPNDTPSMAAPLSLAEVTAGINGSLHFTRNALNSQRGTDDTDMYRITITEAGMYTVDMSLLTGTESSTSLDARFIDDNALEIPITTSYLNLYKEGDTHSADVNLAVGSYNLKIYRKDSVAKYSFKMTKKN